MEQVFGVFGRSLEKLSLRNSDLEDSTLTSIIEGIQLGLKIN